MFQLQSAYQPAWDQTKAIAEIVESYRNGLSNVSLLWATWTWKTFTMANVISHIKKPTLIISHNKTLAAQLATEFKYFFPNNAVHYFVSYFDYYQPEAYIPAKDIYIEKESTINKEIEMFRLSTMASLLSREDVIIVASVSSLYGLWAKENFANNRLFMEVGKEYSFKSIREKLLFMQYKPVQGKIEQSMFDIKGDIIDIYSSLENVLYRCIFNEEELEHIQVKDTLTFKDLWSVNKVTLWPATQFLQDMSDLNPILAEIEAEMNERVAEFKKQWRELEANRILKKTSYDLRMIKETGFTNWIENYSRYFDRRFPWQPPHTLFDYFPDDFLFIVDESHMTIPQLQWMPAWDKSRKINLIEHWFRLPSAIDHRPLNFQELEYILDWNRSNQQELDISLLDWRIKKSPKSLFVSATPWEYELNYWQKVVEQIIRPTGLLDPLTYIQPKSGDYEMLMSSLTDLLKKRPRLKEYLDWYDQEVDLFDLFYSNK